ncbi:hypothetical protein HanXRQr2_Chr16g0765101 [Helianthus annuus]|uniref:Putative concanavalin A-like lectin/glucanase domain-containing protein n=1 Tax=Helianthus annuus TaxID=4232 RepID=A0A251S5Y2_HELAN|nr:hypothetical protein HanXRQr2_Chr16g0765101 [Helianthus annuus]KAJ0461646.1 hypothetical protein HanHA89_Chr16g0674651 [Helianthus annuus]KAJ0645940.1 hypothetical protein HanOQP8_Chr16g0629561 [Helianthus annuus]KAJ0822538.1 hypothetical protein HanPSC8_Chr16g0733261 [Helianthus annuus]
MSFKVTERNGLNEYSSYQRGTHRYYVNVEIGDSPKSIDITFVSQDKGVAYPGWQPMGMKIKICDGSSWATCGGKDIVDLSKEAVEPDSSVITIKFAETSHAAADSLSNGDLEVDPSDDIAIDPPNKVEVTNVV